MEEGSLEEEVAPTALREAASAADAAFGARGAAAADTRAAAALAAAAAFGAAAFGAAARGAPAELAGGLGCAAVGGFC